MNASSKIFSELTVNELETIEGGIMVIRDAEGREISDCLGRIVRLEGGGTIWVPHGTSVPGETL